MNAARVLRDLGCLDQYDKVQTEGLLSPTGDTQAAKLLAHVHKLARRGTASSTTLQTIRKMNANKQKLLLLLAFRVLPSHKWRLFRLKFNMLRDRTTYLCRIDLKPPFASTPQVKLAYRDEIRQAL